jgi:hypothetical protein
MMAWRIAIGEWIGASGFGFALLVTALLTVGTIAAVLIIAMKRGNHVSFGGPKGFVFRAKAEYSNKIEKVQK